MKEALSGGSASRNLGYGERAVDLRPEEDFGPEAARKRETAKQADFIESRREIERKVSNLSAQPETVTPGRGGVSQKNLGIAYYQQQAQELLKRERDRRDIVDFNSLPSVKQMIDAAEANGVTLSADDVRNFVDFGVLNDAADRVITALKAGDEVGVTNVYTTLNASSKQMGFILPDIVEAKLAEIAQDPSFVSDAVAKLSEIVSFALTPFVAANDWATQGVRAGSYRINEDLADGGVDFGPASFTRGFFSAEDRAAVGVDKFNMEYIRQIREATNPDGTPIYNPLQVDIALDVAMASAKGDPDSILSVWRSKYAGDEEAAKVFRDIMYSRADGNTQELLRQIDSAYLGNTGQVSFGAADRTAIYDPARGSETRQDLANAAGLGIALAYDPTLFLGRGVKAVKAVMWGLERIAPGVSASEVLSKARFGRLEVATPAYRYFNSLAKYLNRLEDYDRAAVAAGKAGREAATDAEKAAAASRKLSFEQKAASLRQRMSRQFDELPDDLIDEFRSSPWRNADGKFDVEHIAAHIDDANDAYVTALGDVSEKLAVAGATRSSLFEAALAINSDNMATAAAKQIARADLADAERTVKQLTKQRDSLRSVDQRIAARTETRTALVPRMSLVAQARIAAVNRLSMMLMPQDDAFRLVDQYLANNGDVAVFGEALNATAMPFGKATRNLKFSAAGFGDSIGRMFSSIATATRFNVATGDDSLQVYRYARSFFPKRTAELIADMYRRGDAGSRRLVVMGLARSAMASRGLTMSRQEAEEFVLGLKPEAARAITGSMAGEQYAVSVPVGMLPSQKAAMVEARRRVAGPDAPLDFDAATDSGVWKSLSADGNGQEHAIHLAQTADYVVVPSIREMERMRSGLRVGFGDAAETVTNMWSLGTLFGLRFSIRNAIEEIGMYWLLGGKALDLYRGRKLDQAIRRVRPMLTPVVGEDGVDVAMKSSLGMVAKRAEWTSRWLQNKGFPEWFAEMIYHPLDENQIKAAGVALANGDTQAFSRLAIESLAAQRVFGFRTNLTSEQDREAFKYLVDSTHGMALLDEVGEAGTYLQSGGFPAYVDAMYGIAEVGPGIEYGKMPRVSFGDYGNVEPVGRIGTDDVYGLGFWWRELQTTLDGDGPIGKAAVAGLGNPAATKKKIAEIIRTDTEFGYKERFSRIRSDQDIDDFADSYFENVFQHFTRRDGTLNRDLQAQFLDVDPVTGEVTASWWKALEPKDIEDLSPVEKRLARTSGMVAPRVSRASLNKFKRDDRPEFIFGRDVVPFVPNAANETALLGDRAFAWMGRQNARISRDPIFLANYLNVFRQTGTQRRQLAEALAAKRAAKEGTEAVVSEADIALADQVYASESMDAAFGLALSYIDNPANRSNLAWKVRNVARYYRATEDFYRRVKRMVKNDPFALWKGALTYQLLRDNGFTYTNDNGEEYFAYPMNTLGQEALVKAMSLFNVPLRQYTDLTPFNLAGRMTGLTPSADPAQAVPTLSGPLAAPMAGILGALPSLAGIRTALLGQYSQTTGNPWADMVQAILPAGVAKVLRSSDPQFINSQIASAAFDTAALMTAEGMLDVLTVDGVPLEMAPAEVDATTFFRTDQYKSANLIAASYFWSKFAMSWILPANPQGYSNTASEYAKQNGIDSIDDAYYDLLDKYTGDPDGMRFALADFYAMRKPSQNGLYDGWGSMLPFTTSGTKFDEFSNPGASLMSVRATDDLHKWVQSDEANDLFTKFGEAAWFTAPTTGEFTWDSHAMLTTLMKIKVSKTEAERYDELFALQGKTIDLKIRRDFDEAIAQAQSPEERKALEEERKTALDANKANNPPWERYQSKYGPNPARNPVMSTDLLSKTSQMLEYLEQKNGSLTRDQQMIANAIMVYTEYKGQASGLRGTVQQKQGAKKALAASMDAELAAIRLESENAKRFIDGVLGADPNYVFGVE